MYRFAQILRTSTVRLTATFILIFGIFAILLLAFIGWQSSAQIQRQQAEDIDREMRVLQRIDATQGIRALVFAVDRVSRAPGPGVYFLGDAAGEYLLGNVADVPVEVLIHPGMYSFDYQRINPFADTPGQGEDIGARNNWLCGGAIGRTEQWHAAGGGPGRGGAPRFFGHHRAELSWWAWWGSSCSRLSPGA